MTKPAGFSTSQTEVYRCAPFLRFRFGQGSELLYFPHAGANRVLPSLEDYILSRWTQFRTLDDQIELITDSIPGIATNQIRELLTRFREDGLLITASSLGAGIPYNAVDQSSVDESSREIQWLAIPTCGRRPSLIQCIKSYAGNRHQSRRRYKILVSDDSNDSEISTQVQSSLRSIAAEIDYDIVYLGREEKARMCEYLTQNHTIPLEIVQLALFGYENARRKTGSNRNCVLLKTAGTLIYSVDDDMVCDPARVTGTDDDAVVFEAHRNPCGIWPFPDRDEALGFTHRAAIDVVDEHERFLGRSPGFVLAHGARYKVSLDGMCNHILNSLISGRAIVRMTFNGSRGDCGWHSNMGLIGSHNRDTRQRVQSAADYDSVTRSRQLVLQVKSYTLSHGDTSGMGMCFGLDNRELLPPYVPGFDNEDGIFATLLSRCSDDASIAHLPFTLIHDPPEERFYPAGRGIPTRMCDIFKGFISAWNPEPGLADVRSRLLSLGRYFVQMGQMPAPDFREALQIVACSRASALCQYFAEPLLEDKDAPKQWSTDVEDQIGAIRRSLEMPDYYIPRDVTFTAGEDPVCTVQKIIGRFGDLLLWWPAIVQRAMTMTHG